MGDLKKRILVVEDEEHLLDLIEMRLEANGFEVLTAADGQEALDLARSENPDLILMDLMLPKLDGFQACSALKEDLFTKEIPVIILTARKQENDRLLAKEIGVAEYLTKSIPIEELPDKIHGYFAA